MLITDYQTYEDYFKEIAIGSTGHKDTKDFYLGSVNEIQQAVLNKLSYPCLWLEDPDIPFANVGRDYDNVGFIGAFLILFHCDPNDFEQIKSYKQQAFLIARDVVSRMKKDFEARELNIDGSFSGNVIDSILVDSACGWRFEFSIKDPFDLQYISANWKS